MKAKLILLFAPGPQSTAANQFSGGSLKDRPVLNPKLFIVFYLTLKPVFNVTLAEAAAGADISGDFGIAPKELCQRKILIAPFGKADSVCFQKVSFIHRLSCKSDIQSIRPCFDRSNALSAVEQLSFDDFGISRHAYIQFLHGLTKLAAAGGSEENDLLA